MDTVSYYVADGGREVVISFTEPMAEEVFEETLDAVIFISKEREMAEKMESGLMVMSKMVIYNHDFFDLDRCAESAGINLSGDLEVAKNVLLGYYWGLRSCVIYVIILRVVSGRFLPISPVNLHNYCSHREVLDSSFLKRMADNRLVGMRSEVCRTIDG